MDASATNNSSDFVRKLYKMLEDPSYNDIVRWNDTGDSFVVLENERFTKQILPKHFKHSNFASFVRQLNKYDFHKVKASDQENGQSTYGPGAWEFKHDQFRANNRDSLDSIKRKAPAPRRQPNQPSEESLPAQQMDLVNSQLVATQHQLQHLQERYNDLASGHIVLLQQVVQLQKIVKNHDGVMHRVMGFLHSVDAQRRNSRVPGMLPNGSNGIGINDLIGQGPDDHPASPLQQASELLGEFSAENLINKDLLERMTVDYSFRDEYSTPPNDQSASSGLGPTSNGLMGYLSTSQDLDNVVYPVGQTNGIDPINSEHIHNIPYALPASGMIAPDHSDMLIAKPMVQERKPSMSDPAWGSRKPRVLLVEDDKICARIGCKFLARFECGVETARDGLEAVNKVNNGPNSFDLIFMDIIMPHLDGVSATACIREINSTIPIIAMTSNIRSEDIDMYFRYGMNDVLPKPFTKEGMLRSLEKHLPHFKKSYDPQVRLSGGFVTPTTSQTPINLNLTHMSASHSLKDENSPAKSPAGSWHSPNGLTSGSPVSASQGNYPMANYSLTPTQSHGFQPPPPMGAPRPGQGPPPRSHQRVVSDMSDRGQDGPDKRQRIYPPQQGAFQQ